MQKTLVLFFLSFSILFSQNTETLTLDDNAAINTSYELIEKAKNENDTYKIAQSYYQIGYIYLSKNLYHKAYINLNESLNYYNKSNQNVTLEKALVFRSIATIYYGINHKKKALETLDKIVTLTIDSKYNFEFDTVYMLYGNIYKDRKENEKALDYYKQAEKHLTTKSSNNQLTSCLIHQAILHVENEDLDLSRTIVDKIDSLNTPSNSIADKALIAYVKAFISFKENDLFEAQKIAKTALEYSQEKEENIYITSDILKLLFDINLALNNPKAIAKYSDLYVVNKNRIEELENNNRFYREQINHEVSKIQTDIAKEKETAIVNKAKRSKIFRLFLTIAIPIIVFSLLFLISKDRKLAKFKAKELLAYEEKQKLQKEIEQIENTITQDLQDNFGSRLNGITSAYKIIKDLNTKEQFSHPLLNKFGKLIENNLLPLMHDITDMLWANNTENNTINRIVNKFQEIIKSGYINKNVNLIFNDLNNNQRIILPRSSHKHLLFIIKEAINNSVKHSKSPNINITISLNDENFLELIIKDFGIGFDISKLKRINGLHNMKKRASLINFNFDLVSNTEGTTITLISKSPLIESSKNDIDKMNITQMA